MSYVPLSNGFMITSIIGAIICGWLTLFGSEAFLPWGFTMTFMFILFIIASMVSVSPEA